MAPATRLQQVLRLIREKLADRECTVKVEKHRVVEDTEYLRLTILCPGGIALHIREFVRASTIIRYSYQLLVNNEGVLRYDNTPHHPEIRTYPHHKHEKGKVGPLHDPSLQAFLEEALKLLASHP